MSRYDDFYELLARRRMCRSYLRDPVPKHRLLRILKAASRCPSAGHAQGTRFAVVTSPEARASIAAVLKEEAFVAKGFSPWFSVAPVHILVGVSSSAYRSRYAESDKSTGPDQWPLPYDVLDAGKALMTLYLAAHHEGLACGYLGPHKAQDALTLFPWPSDWRFAGLVTVGFPDETLRRPSRSHARGWRPFDEVVEWWDLPVQPMGQNR